MASGKVTFHRYRENIQSQFGITVECDKSDGYRYYLKRDPIANDDVTEWMLSSLRLASLGDMLKYHNKVMLDTPPYNTEYHRAETRKFEAGDDWYLEGYDDEL